jgi:hypothetical protein
MGSNEGMSSSGTPATGSPPVRTLACSHYRSQCVPEYSGTGDKVKLSLRIMEEGVKI